MKKGIIFLLIVFSVINGLAKSDSVLIVSKIKLLELKVNEQDNKLNKFYLELDKEYRTYKILKEEFRTKYTAQTKAIDSLKQVINTNSSNIKKTAGELGVKVDDTYKLTTERIENFDKSLSRNSLYWIIAVLGVAVFALVSFILLRKQLFKQKTDMDSDIADAKKQFEEKNAKLSSNIQETRKTLEEEGVKLDNKLIEVLETQLKIINNNNSGNGSETDHTLALKVADEIVRIEKNMSKLDPDIKGLKPLSKGIERIKDNFKANGYDMVQLLNKEYDDRMNIDVINFIDDETIPSGKKLITRIIRPQVNYKEVLIQRAQVDVSQN